MKRAFLSVLLILIACNVFYSCTKNYGDPVLSFKTGSGFISNDTILKVTDSIRIGLEAAWNGHDMLDKLEIRVNDELVSSYTIDDEAVNFTLTLVKGAQETEVWEFLVSDLAGNSSSETMTLTKDPNSIYGGVIFFTSIVLGAQNSSKPGFLGLNPATTYLLDQAFLKQDQIDLLCYYNGTDFTTIASPGSDMPDDIFSGSRNLPLWTTRNRTQFIKMDLDEREFLAVTLDVLMVNAWKDTGSTDKAAELKAGDVYLFKLQSGKKGLILIKRLISLEDGEVEFAVKIQE